MATQTEIWERLTTEQKKHWLDVKERDDAIKRLEAKVEQLRRQLRGDTGDQR